MVKDYELQLTKTGGTTMGKERYGTAMQSAEDLNYGDLLTEAVTKYAERATQAEGKLFQMEATFEGEFAMMSMQKPQQPPLYQPLPPHTQHT